MKKVTSCIFSQCLWHMPLAGDPTSPDASDSSCEHSEVDCSQQETGVVSRFQDLSWCKRGSCSVATLPHEEECLCCHEIHAIQHIILLKEEGLTWITANVIFQYFAMMLSLWTWSYWVRLISRQIRSHDKLLAGKE